MIRFFTVAGALALSLAAGTSQARVVGERVERPAPDRVIVSWTAAGPVDVYASERPDAPRERMKLVSDDDKDGRHEFAADLISRPYFLLVDAADGEATRVAERVLPLAQGSNFRDLGGYRTEDGRSVRWGRIYRSGATPTLTDEDLRRVRELGLSQMVDLRSSEERVLAPSKIEGVPYSSVGYSMAAIAQNRNAGVPDMEAIYRGFPQLLAPQVRVLFASLLRNEGPVVYNCSAGQDRTGFASALILRALGVPMQTVLADYHLSTTYRRPQYEMPKLTPELIASNPGAAIYAQYQKDPKYLTPQPLKDSSGRGYLTFALEEVDRRWGSVAAYLQAEAGVGPAELARLRALYLE
ncbi:MAG: tyrosine-protein phosphatase [Phenylobacterium sp.]|uniref:tyrosine-protein phosphatase n=1 Tax=Phenylobacterium sp. TaxID=1871053 RepID=UPI0025E449B1|nr:tyrosine-protein phosphatase [Phenylobacterium sp.]MCA6226884.1 tyrosine-protein phosphatase [Phenylobacterium sp.]MCA6231547.1 tyrosine-protein phosphatase [Phenylobacterium sp.]MCA6234947.1 tyrosine-protein phosphatase [Phenylobacterium sp.]MCA6249431.1 tyrosine-protein phosphatase [Phenylobacterium sp.]MCA6251392.1 tyrosine-protein phosphatase [Phenylobacterium sp.]